MKERRRRKIKKLMILAAVIIIATGCANNKSSQMNSAGSIEETPPDNLEIQTEKKTDQQVEQPVTVKNNQTKSKIVVIDPGHSSIIPEGEEPLGPDSSEYKAADAYGTSGVSTGVPEYELTLQLSIQLKSALEAQGYTVLLTKESNDVAMSCVQRADVANNAGADAYIRIHANGSENSEEQGAMTICTTSQNEFVPELYQQSRNLSDCIIYNLCNVAKCENDGVWETDSMSGNNWSKVPVTIVEVGYMTNSEEDVKMQTSEYQVLIVQGIVNGVNQYFGY